MKYLLLLFIYLISLPTVISASPEYEEYLRVEEHRDAEITRFLKYIEFNIEHFFEALSPSFSIDHQFYTHRDIFIEHTGTVYPGNNLLDRFVLDWAYLYESLPVDYKYIVPRWIVLYFEDNDTGFFSFSVEDQRWKMLTSEQAINVVSEKLSETYIRYYYHAPAA